MIFVVLSDEGIDTQPLEATSQADAANQLKQLHGRGSGQVRFALMFPTIMGVIQQAADPANATIQMAGDAQTQKTIRDNLQAFLAIQAPTNAQVLAAVRALARLAVADLSGTS
jgi:hypothetical protein